MNYDAKQLKTALENGCPVFYFYSTEEYLVQAHAQKVLKVLAKEDPDMTRLEGPTPAVEEILLAAGTISFFSTRRVVVLPLLQPMGKRIWSCCVMRCAAPKMPCL